MELIYYIYTVIDSIIMPFIRFPDNPQIGYFLGTFLLSLACIGIGKISISCALRLNKEKIDHHNLEIKHYQQLSVEALKTGDKAAYKACNRIAIDAYGRTFFLQAALSASILWPVFLALGWMQYHFSDTVFKTPVSFFCNNCTVGYGATFLVCYISARLLTSFFRQKVWSFQSRSRRN